MNTLFGWIAKSHCEATGLDMAMGMFWALMLAGAVIAVLVWKREK